MNKGIIGKKLGMTQIFQEDGTCVPVSVVQAGPCVVLQKKSSTVDGYTALQLGYDAVNAIKANSALRGHCMKAGKGVFRYLREFKFNQMDSLNIGDELTVTQFAVGDLIDVTGISIGKGFQGVIKRHNFKGGRASHGSRFHRAPGSIGCSATPSRVFKNKKMPGQMGNERVTVQRLQVVRVDVDQNLILIKGAIPGSKNNVVIIKDSIKATK